MVGMWVTGQDRSQIWLEEFERQEFFAERWDWHPGEHVTIIAPTGEGKTRFVGGLLAHSVSPRTPVMRFALKGHDVVMRQQCKDMGIKIVKDWPPWWVGRPNGWALWPTETDDPDADDVRWANAVRRALLWVRANMRKAKRDGIIVDADEMEEIQRLLAVLGRMGMLRGMYRRWRSSGGSIWTGCQAPKHLITDAYSQASHLFLGNDPEQRNRERFGEIGGVDPKLVERAVLALPPYHFLYRRRKGKVMCVVGP